MDKIVGVCITLLVLAVAFVLLTEGGEMAALVNALRSQPLPLRAAWVVIVLVPLALLVSAVLLCDMLLRQRRSARALSLRLDGVRTGVKGLINSQVDVEAAVHQLARTDPEDALGAVQQRLTEAERFAQVQQSRNESSDLESRVEFVRARQQALKERLLPVLETRRSIELLFMELEGRQSDIAHTLEEIASGDDAVAVDLGLNNMIEFVKQGHRRCDEIERAAKLMVALKEDYVALRGRVAPFVAERGGVANLLQELHAARDELAADLEAVEQTPIGPLAQQVQKLTDDRRVLDSRLAEITEDFSRLATLRRDLGGLFAGFHRALDVLAVSRRGDGAADVDARVEELMAFIAGAHADLDEIERRVATFAQLRAKLDELLAQLAPLESEQGGVASVIEEVKAVRDKLALKIRRLEASDEGDLAERVRRFTETKMQLEQRVSLLSDQFFKLATIRKDIAGLFQELSSAVSASAN